MELKGFKEFDKILVENKRKKLQKLYLKNF